jgi:hypothetical protein
MRHSEALLEDQQRSREEVKQRILVSACRFRPTVAVERFDAFTDEVEPIIKQVQL